jgi:hypothetical protein
MPRLADLDGTQLPEGSFVISPDDDRQVAKILGAENDETGAHPLWAFIATQRGIGVSVAELCALADFDVADGPLLGGWHAVYHGKIVTGQHYRVTGEIVDIVRKQGKSGTFDVMKFVERLIGDDDVTVVETTTTFVLPRKSP